MISRLYDLPPGYPDSPASVSDIFNRLYLELGSDTFIELFPVILADNGSEFSDPRCIEFDANGNRRTWMFDCNAAAPYQKGSCEVHHEMIRRIIPKSVDITPYSQEQMDAMISHMNSYRRKALDKKSPYEMFVFQHGEDVLKKFGLRKIPPDEIILSPKLFNEYISTGASDVKNHPIHRFYGWNLKVPNFSVSVRPPVKIRTFWETAVP